MSSDSVNLSGRAKSATRLEPITKPIEIKQKRPKSETKNPLSRGSSKQILEPLTNPPLPNDPWMVQSNAWTEKDFLELASNGALSSGSSLSTVANDVKLCENNDTSSPSLISAGASKGSMPRLNKRTASIIIQRRFRGHFVRKNFEKLTFLEYLDRRQFAYELIDSLVDEFLEDEIIPDLLIYSIKELDSHNLGLDKDEYKVGDTVYRDKEFPLKNVVEDLIFKDFLPVLTKEVVSMTSSDLIKGYFVDRLKERKDPYQQISGIFLEEELEFLTADIVEESIDEMVQDYLRDAKMLEWIVDMTNDSINESLKIIVEECIQELGYTWIIEDLIEEEVGLFAQVVSEDSLVELEGYFKSIDNKDIAQIVSQKMMDSLLTERLLQHISSGGDEMVLNDHFERTFNDLAVSTLLFEYMAISNHNREVRENMVINQTHRRVSFDIALEAISHEFVECMEDDLYAMHMEEKQREEDFERENRTTNKNQKQRDDVIMEFRAWMADENTLIK
eukprot:Nk52_evm17s222 gene=Nk52_evmTU17s222